MAVKRLNVVRREFLGDLLEDYFYYSPLCGYSRDYLAEKIAAQIWGLAEWRGCGNGIA